MSLRFEWNEAKAEANLRKHGVGFDEAATAFADPLSLTIPDPEHSEGEERYVLLGVTVAQKLVAVCHTERGATIRIISARPASRLERRDYENG